MLRKVGCHALGCPACQRIQNTRFWVSLKSLYKTQKDTMCAKTHGTKLTPNRVYKPSNVAKSSAVRPRYFTQESTSQRCLHSNEQMKKFYLGCLCHMKSIVILIITTIIIITTFTLLTLHGMFQYKTCSSSSLPRWELRPSAQWSNRDVAWPLGIQQNFEIHKSIQKDQWDRNTRPIWSTIKQMLLRLPQSYCMHMYANIISPKIQIKYTHVHIYTWLCISCAYLSIYVHNIYI